MKKIEEIIKILKENNQTISFAESCTGGLLSSSFVEISGVSAVFNGSFVTYSNKIKQEWLGVKDKTLINFGAVSKECVEEMLEGVKLKAKSDYAVAISGIAGPDGGSEEKPVGTVYIGFLTPKEKIVFKNVFKGKRLEVQEQAKEFSIEKLINFLKKT